MALHAPAQAMEFDLVAEEAVGHLKAEGKRKPGSLCDPGSISAELAVALAKFVPSSLIAERIRELVNATRINRDGNEEPDVRAREAGLKLALAYKVGTPIARSESVNVNLDADNAVGLADRLRDSPALRAMMRKMIERAEDVPKQG